MHQGSCLCGTVRYQIGEIGPIDFCHCSRCRKANGTAFLSGAQVMNPAEFKLISGADSLGDFESSPGVHRIFCKRCGSPLFSRRPGPPEVIRIRIGSLDSSIHSKPRAHIFYADRADWFEFEDDLPKFEQRP